MRRVVITGFGIVSSLGGEPEVRPVRYYLSTGICCHGLAFARSWVYQES